MVTFPLVFFFQFVHTIEFSNYKGVSTFKAAVLFVDTKLLFTFGYNVVEAAAWVSDDYKQNTPSIAEKNYRQHHDYYGIDEKNIRDMHISTAVLQFFG